MKVPKKIEIATARMVACVKGGEFRRDRIIKAGTKYSRDIDVCVTGCGAAMLLTDLINAGVLVETWHPDFGEMRIKVGSL